MSIGFTFKVTQALIDEGISGLRIDSASETSHPYAKTTFIDNILVKKYSGEVLKETDVDYDGIGIQSHYDSVIKNPSQIVDLYEKLRTRYGKRIKVTEYSCSKFDEILQANYTRDVLSILCGRKYGRVPLLGILGRFTLCRYKSFL